MITKELKEIEGKTRCTGCEFKGTDGCGPGPVMICEHPHWNGCGSYENAIISHVHNNGVYVGAYSDKCPKSKYI